MHFSCSEFTMEIMERFSPKGCFAFDIDLELIRKAKKLSKKRKDVSWFTMDFLNDAPVTKVKRDIISW